MPQQNSRTLQVFQDPCEPCVPMGNCFWCYVGQLFMYLDLRRCKNDCKILKIILVLDFCPLNPEVARFSIGFRRKFCSFSFIHCCHWSKVITYQSGFAHDLLFSLKVNIKLSWLENTITFFASYILHILLRPGTVVQNGTFDVVRCASPFFSSSFSSSSIFFRGSGFQLTECRTTNTPNQNQSNQSSQ